MSLSDQSIDLCIDTFSQLQRLNQELQTKSRNEACEQSTKPKKERKEDESSKTPERKQMDKKKILKERLSTSVTSPRMNLCFLQMATNR